MVAGLGEERTPGPREAVSSYKYPAHNKTFLAQFDNHLVSERSDYVEM